jgi:hypothetical protein
MLKSSTKPASPGSTGDGKLVQLVLPRFARSEEHFETRPGPQKKGGA